MPAATTQRGRVVTPTLPRAATTRRATGGGAASTRGGALSHRKATSSGKPNAATQTPAKPQTKRPLLTRQSSRELADALKSMLSEADLAQQQQQRSAALIAAAVANSTYPPIHLYVHISHSVTSKSNECQAPYQTSYTYQVNKSQPRLTNFAATIFFPPRTKLTNSTTPNQPFTPKSEPKHKAETQRQKKKHTQKHACSEKTHPTLAFKP